MKNSKQKAKAKKPSEKLLAIRAVKKSLHDVNVQAVAEYLDCTRANIYYHLNEDNAENVSLPHLAKISEAIKEVKRLKEEAEQKLISSLK